MRAENGFDFPPLRIFNGLLTRFRLSAAWQLAPNNVLYRRVGPAAGACAREGRTPHPEIMHDEGGSCELATSCELRWWAEA